MTLGSLFDGIGCWQLAAQRAGIQTLWSSEIDNFCLNVTRHHFPETIQLGDINGIDCPPHVDIISASSPCQDLSLAGKRSGIHAERSGLFFKAVELVRRVRPQFFIWENVTGAFSSNGGADFHTVLETILQEPIPIPKRWCNAGLVDGRNCQIAWRVLDAQYWGCAQRRRRIFLVADFTGRRAAEILFEPASMSGDIAPRQKSQRQTAARTGGNATPSIGFDTGHTYPWASYELTPTQHVNTRIGASYSVYDMTHADEVLRPVTGDKSNCLNQRMGTGGNQIPIVFGIGRDAFNQGDNALFRPTIENNLQPPLTARGAGAVGERVVRRLTPVECERLMGLPDEWTNHGSDTARYRALGNAIAVPCAEFIFKRLMEKTCND